MFTSDPKAGAADLLLIEFQPAAAVDGLEVGLRSMLADGAGAIQDIDVCQALEDHRLWIYLKLAAGVEAAGRLVKTHLAGAAAGDIDLTTLITVRTYAGASPQAAPVFHYVVWTDVAEGGGDELERWYDQEHMPGLAAVPGTVRARRFLAPHNPRRYYACYDLESPGVLETPAWLAVRGTAWSALVRPTFRNPRRVMTRRLMTIQP